MTTKIIIISIHNENVSTNRCDQNNYVYTYSVVCMQEIMYTFWIGAY